MKIIDVENIDEAVSATNNVLDEIFHQKVVNSIAGTIVVSTIASFITIPIIVFIALKYFN